MTEPRTSNVVYVVARLRIEGRDGFLLHEHRKWGDWGLVGGHVEAWEEGDWAAAARREVEEEMHPLRVGRDLRLVPLPDGPESWGPVPSRSAGDRPTVYRARWFAMELLREPARCFEALPRERFLWIERSRLETGRDADVTGLLLRLGESLPGGLDAVPYAWPSGVTAGDLLLSRRG